MSEPTAPGVYTSLAELVNLRHEARGFSFLPRQPVTRLLAGGRASKLRGRGLGFEEVRTYLPGDDPRTIDWKVTARTRTPGNDSDAVADSNTPLDGSVDPKSQRVARSIGEKKDIVFEAGLTNRTKNENTVLIHYGKDRTEQQILIRLEEPQEK